LKNLFFKRCIIHFGYELTCHSLPPAALPLWTAGKT